MYWDHIIRNGTIVTPCSTYKANIYVKDGKIAAITKDELQGNVNEVTMQVENMYYLV